MKIKLLIPFNFEKKKNQTCVDNMDNIDEINESRWKLFKQYVEQGTFFLTILKNI